MLDLLLLAPAGALFAVPCCSCCCCCASSTLLSDSRCCPCSRFVDGRRSRCSVDVARPKLMSDCPTHLLARRPPSIYHYWIIDPTTLLLLCHIKAAHSNERGALCFGRSSSGGGMEVVGLWCVGVSLVCVARTRTDPPIGNHGAPDPPPPPPTTPSAPNCTLRERQSPKSKPFPTEICISHLLQLAPKKKSCQLWHSDTHRLSTLVAVLPTLFWWHTFQKHCYFGVSMMVVWHWGWFPILEVVASMPPPTTHLPSIYNMPVANLYWLPLPACCQDTPSMGFPQHILPPFLPLPK